MVFTNRHQTPPAWREDQIGVSHLVVGGDRFGYLTDRLSINLLVGKVDEINRFAANVVGATAVLVHTRPRTERLRGDVFNLTLC